MTKKEALKKLRDLIDLELKVTAPNTEELVKTLKKAGYEERCGSCAYKRQYLTIQPFKKYFWKDNITYTEV